MQRLGGCLREVVTYESRTARAKFLIQLSMEWYVYSKRIMKVYFPLPITGSFIDKIIGYSTWQFMYGTWVINLWLKNFIRVHDFLYRNVAKTFHEQRLNFLNWNLEIWCVDNNDSQRINSFLFNFYNVLHCLVRPCVEWLLTGGWKQ